MIIIAVLVVVMIYIAYMAWFLRRQAARRRNTEVDVFNYFVPPSPEIKSVDDLRRYFVDREAGIKAYEDAGRVKELRGMSVN